MKKCIKCAGQGRAYSWESETSPVMAENPRKGLGGREIFGMKKQSVHSSPRKCGILLFI